MSKKNKPLILAPAGDENTFLAAVAAGADAVYCGLKIFSARMEAGNFSMEALSRLNALARTKGVKVHVAFNSLVKHAEEDKVRRLLTKLNKYVHPHALIIQDPGVAAMAKQIGFKGELHLSTLANCTFPGGLEAAKKMGISKVVLPRELSIDEIKTMAKNTPEDLDLETFIHGALCYGVSGRCYWSSWFGGRSSLRGRCVQPCRRMYRQGNNRQRYFSCFDLSADVLVKVLKEIPRVTTWKIEGRKKSPHYVFYTVKAYKMLRDHGHDPQKKKIALSFLEYAMGRPATHYNLLSQRPQSPLQKDTETGSGLFIGRVKKGENIHFITREPLLQGDLLRIGYEDDRGHFIQRVTRSMPKKGKLVLKPGKGIKPGKGTPVFIVDRREPEVNALIRDLSTTLEKFSSPDISPMIGDAGEKSTPQRKKNQPPPDRPREIFLFRSPPKGRTQGTPARWLTLQAVKNETGKKLKQTWWFLPPVLWPEEETELKQAIEIAQQRHARHFVLNIPWQIALFDTPAKLNVWAGPFCNIANGSHLAWLEKMGFSGAVVSPELTREDFLCLPAVTSLSLGVVIEGNWPLAISRIISPDISPDSPFLSPMGESSWISRRENNHWVFPGWRLNLTPVKETLYQAGYRHFFTMEEPVNKEISLKKRQGLWNWDLTLL
ncbi:putative protease [Desulfocicer vacuolatum DSM 3385]|uniref:Putative protease n=1 Tax=Desulfocicer vacuolatum DSM 3385 TaxID=1121400 RepID=A0A1W1Z0P9_9BACT|nr:U32 family peptidase [Desulfocicer vacuolatum]SMC41964.1 putative protease [Desulfocicer vacuolatum DSM 3385]